ncbi:hypothetical protein FPV67DRAFT_1629387 [Lyophyllum atratum]|nr:hypothetical protein FPV67DRAFT_1629387 [Lyophyllum atratum]
MEGKAQLCPIPQGVVAYITGTNAETRLYALWKNGEMIVIQAPSLVGPHPEAVPDAEYDEFDKVFLYGLEELQTVIHTIEFGKTNWGYLSRRKGGGYEIMQKRRSLRKLTCRTWERLISRKEISFTRFWQIDIWNGYWKGQEIDVFMAYNDRSMYSLDREMWGYLALQGLNLTYQALGHVVDDDGTVVGLAYEAHAGRVLQYRDRSLVYDALARVEQRGLIYCGAQGPQNFTIMNGKVRLTNLASIWHVPDEELRRKKGLDRHWNSLETLFPMLKLQQDMPPQPVVQRSMAQNLLLLSRVSPERPIFIRFTLDPFNDSDRAKNNSEFVSRLRRTAPSRKRLTPSGKVIASSRDAVVAWAAVPDCTEDWGRNAVRRGAQGSRAHRGKHISSPLLTLMSDSESNESSIDYDAASTPDSSPRRRLAIGFIRDSDTDSTYDTETIAST